MAGEVQILAFIHWHMVHSARVPVLNLMGIFRMCKRVHVYDAHLKAVIQHQSQLVPFKFVINATGIIHIF